MTLRLIIVCLSWLITSGCKEPIVNNQLKNSYVAELEASNHHYNNDRIALLYKDKVLSEPLSKHDHQLSSAIEQLKGGKTVAAISELEKLMEIAEGTETLLSSRDRLTFHNNILQYLGLAYLRLGEQQNCIINHHHSSCIIPLTPGAFHQLDQGSTQAIIYFQRLLDNQPNDFETRYLLNLAYMTLGRYPQEVPAPYLIKSELLQTGSARVVKNIAMHNNLAINNLAGGVIADDFNNDGRLDLVVSSWDITSNIQLFVNENYGWLEETETTGLQNIPGGLNLLQTDYNNDGWLDILVLRGGWLGLYGHLPNTLLKNEGFNDRGQLQFTDVTIQAGLQSELPTQTATWADFNNDGWLDLYIGNESAVTGYFNPSELYLNNQNGTFSEQAKAAGVELVNAENNTQLIVKGVIAGDTDNDGWMDLFISTRDGRNFLFKNDGLDQFIPHFTDVTENSGLDMFAKTFSCWFWDYDNDGFEDLLVSGFHTNGIYEKKSITADFALELVNQPHLATTGFLYRNNGDATFTDVSEKVGLNKILYMMGGNFGDFNNDGWLDFYAGTGDPDLRSVIPNRMFAFNREKFEEITHLGFGNIQKGHGAAFADFDQDGDQDIYMVMGGFYQGDIYPNIMLENQTYPGNHYLKLKLIGTVSNHAAIGARIKVSFWAKEGIREVFRTVNSGGSFGASSLTQHIGVGRATLIDTVEITWPGNGKIQVMTDLEVDQTYTIREMAGP